LSGDEGFRRVQDTGETIADAALRLAGTIDTSGLENSTLRATSVRIAIPHRREDKTSEVVLATVLIGNDIAFVAVPGEAFTGHQIALREKSPVAHTFFLGLGYSGEGIPFTIYLPTKRAAVEGGYGADNTTFLAVGAGEQIVDAAAAAIETLVSMGEIE